jgi:hypothetical protein
MVRKLYMYADQGDITRDSPEALRLKTSGFATVAISTPCQRSFATDTQAPALLPARYPDVI